MNDEEEWTTLQALSVLYAYRQTRTGAGRGDEFGLSGDEQQFQLKSFTENFAVHLAVHRSVGGVRAALQAQVGDITNTLSYKKYVYWLWLFIMSHQ